MFRKVLHLVRKREIRVLPAADDLEHQHAEAVGVGFHCELPSDGVFRRSVATEMNRKLFPRVTTALACTLLPLWLENL